MKKMYAVLLCVGLSASLFGQTQTEFIIGAEWLNKPDNWSYQLTATDWDNVRDLGLKWGHVVYTDLTRATNALNAASINGIKLILERYQFPARNCRRWQYHPEYFLLVPNLRLVNATQAMLRIATVKQNFNSGTLLNRNLGAK